MNWHILVQFFRLPFLIRALISIMIVITLFGSVIHFIEPKNFKTIFDGIWWAFITIATIGYGDYVPKTNFGRVIGMLLFLIGAGIISSFFIGLANTAFSKNNALREGKLMFKGEKHLVIIGWNERSKQLIENLHSTNKQQTIVLIDQTLPKHPYFPVNDIFFIRGNPTTDETLLKANISKADQVIITADPTKNEQQADMLTILTIISIKGLAPDIYVIAEILTSELLNNAKRAGADEIIQSNTHTSYLMANTIHSHGMSEALITMLNQLKGSKIQLIKPEDTMVGKSFLSLSAQLLEKEILLIGIKRGEESFINPPLGFILQDSDQLLVICHRSA